MSDELQLRFRDHLIHDFDGVGKCVMTRRCMRSDHCHCAVPVSHVLQFRDSSSVLQLFRYCNVFSPARAVTRPDRIAACRPGRRDVELDVHISHTGQIAAGLVIWRAVCCSSTRVD
ncbi:MAG TPA: hypothetical protein VGD80_00355 [Kofleriaceae bacterium]